MTIKNRLISMMLIAVVGFVSVFITASIGLEKLGNHISEIGEDKMPRVLFAEEIIAASLSLQRDILRLILVQDAERRERIATRIVEHREKIAKFSEQLKGMAQTPDTRRLLDQIDTTRALPVKLNNQIIELLKNNKHQEAVEIVTGTEYRDGYEAHTSNLKLLIEAEKAQASLSVHQGEADATQIKYWILSISLLALAVLIIISLLVTQSITQAVGQLVNAVSEVTRTATFNTRLPHRKDELNAVSNNLNQLFDSLDKAIHESNKVVNAIAQADFTQRMHGNYVGDLDKLKQGINASANSVSFMMSELEKVMNGLGSGKFNVQMDQRVPQAFRQLVEEALNSIHLIISDINTVMNQMNQGDFGARVRADAKGDLQVMKQNINDAMTRLAGAVAGITQVVTAQSQGDLTQHLNIELKGQLQTLKNAINDASYKLKNIVGQAVMASNIVDDAATQVSQGASNLSSRVQEQAAAIEETSATMTEMASAVQANTNNARKVADLTGQVKHQAGEGVSVMQQTISAMQSIQESSNKINDIVTMIDGIAFQTNLLALNAAVEAARAGEHGRGFAVVAGEVRALAQKAAEAAKEIKELIGDSVDRVERGTLLAQKSGQVLNGIADSIQHVASMVGEIADASSEQSVGIDQVHRSIADIDRVTQENTALVEETTAASESLEREANNLRQSMAFFKT